MSIRKRHSPLRVVITLALLGVVSSALAQVEPKAGTWKTHVLTSGSELRLPPPPDPSATQAELAELRTLAGAARRRRAGPDQLLGRGVARIPLDGAGYVLGTQAD